MASYTTTFDGTEDPLYENGNWYFTPPVSGSKKVVKSAGVAKGSQIGGGGYDDSLAHLAGTFGPTQYSQAVVSCSAPVAAQYHEVSLLFRQFVSASEYYGYQINYNTMNTTGLGYISIGSWNPFGREWILLNQVVGDQYIVNNGDSISGSISGNVITAYINGVQRAQITDNTSLFATGSPGIGFYVEGAASASNYGLTSFYTTDTESTVTLSPPQTMILRNATLRNCRIGV